MAGKTRLYNGRSDTSELLTKICVKPRKKAAFPPSIYPLHSLSPLFKDPTRHYTTTYNHTSTVPRAEGRTVK